MGRKLSAGIRRSMNPLVGKRATRTIRTTPGNIGPSDVGSRRAYGAAVTGFGGYEEGSAVGVSNPDDRNFIPRSENPRSTDPFHGLLPS